VANRQFNLPDVGEGLIEADIIKWHVRPGDTVEVNQTIVEIETAKAVVELPCPFEGTVTDLHVTEGQTVDVGVPIITVDVPGGGGEAAAPAEAPAGAETGEGGGDAGGGDAGEGGGEKRQPVLVGYGAKPSVTKRRPRKPVAGGGASPTATAPAPPGLAAAAVRPAAPPPAATRAPAPAAAPTAAPARTTTSPDGPAAARKGAPGHVVLAKPPVRKLAKDLGVDLATITGTGPQGSITRDDIQAAVAQPTPATAAAGAPAPGVREERVPIKGVRKSTAVAMVQSAFTAPHVTEWLQVDVTEAMAAVKRLRTLPDLADVKVSPLLLVAKALLLAARRHPMINSAWDDAAQEIVVKHYVNLGIAAATDRGLLVPNIKEAQSLSLRELAQALTALVDTARAGKTSLGDLSGGTITITNVGVFGVDAGTPILPTGQSAILSFGQVRDMPWVHEGELAIRKVCTLALSFDHRIVDGELGSAVLADVGAMLEDPLRMIAWG
jgi:2-oxoisovalerate dehydrogenase E2 component (dihydrolipoyl transacylase)